MKIKSNLVYQKSTGRLIGFTEIGEVNDELEAFNSAVSEMNVNDQCDTGRNFATHVLVFIARGIFLNLAYPFRYFSTIGATATQLYPCWMEANRVLTSINLDVRALISDGACTNRKFYDIIKENTNNMFYAINPHKPERRIYLFSDVPHLLKTTRNCFENSHWNKNTRNLMVSYMFVNFNNY